MKLVALKKLRYPRNVHGVEYNVGDTFEALSERDAKALTLVRAAREAGQTLVRAAGQYETRSMQAQPEPDAKAESVAVEVPTSRYSRRDMRAKED